MRPVVVLDKGQKEFAGFDSHRPHRACRLGAGFSEPSLNLTWLGLLIPIHNTWLVSPANLKNKKTCIHIFLIIYIVVAITAFKTLGTQ